MGGMERHFGGKGHLQQLPLTGWIWNARPYTAASAAHISPECWLRTRKHSATTAAGLRRGGSAFRSAFVQQGLGFIRAAVQGVRGTKSSGKDNLSHPGPLPGDNTLATRSARSNTTVVAEWTQIRASTLRTWGQIWPIA